MPSSGNIIDEAGNRYGRLFVIRRDQNNKHHLAQWLCKCDCGKEVICKGINLRIGHTRSCGCLQRDTAARMQRIHGQHKSPRMQMLYRTRSRAKLNDISFDLTIEDIPDIPVKCPVLGISLSAGGTQKNDSPSLDRIKPDFGYTKGNVRIISHPANWIKYNANSDELRAVLEDIVNLENQEVDEYALS